MEFRTGVRFPSAPLKLNKSSIVCDIIVYKKYILFGVLKRIKITALYVTEVIYSVVIFVF